MYPRTEKSHSSYTFSQNERQNQPYPQTGSEPVLFTCEDHIVHYYVTSNARHVKNRVNHLVRTDTREEPEAEHSRVIPVDLLVASLQAALSPTPHSASRATSGPGLGYDWCSPGEDRGDISCDAKIQKHHDFFLFWSIKIVLN